MTLNRFDYRQSTYLYLSETGEIRIEIAHGISEDATRQIKYLPGEGIIGKVIQSGEPAVVPRISEEPLFLDKTHSRDLAQGQDYSYICVPIKKGKFEMADKGTIFLDEIGNMTLAIDMMMDSLKNTSGNINKAAKLIGITVRKFSYKAARYQINYKDYR